jgi:hypothetical protein
MISVIVSFKNDYSDLKPVLDNLLATAEDLSVVEIVA